MSDPRDIVVVDVETNGLDYDVHVPVEVAWWNMNTGARGSFVPRHDVSYVLATASIEALQINRYVDRLATAEQDTGGGKTAMMGQLRGATLAGSNPRFDAHMIRKLLPTETEDPWHYRLLDVGAYGAGVLRLAPYEGIPGLWELAQRLELTHLLETNAHEAWTDVTATGHVLLELWQRAGVPVAGVIPDGRGGLV